MLRPGFKITLPSFRVRCKRPSDIRGVRPSMNYSSVISTNSPIVAITEVCYFWWFRVGSAVGGPCYGVRATLLMGLQTKWLCTQDRRGGSLWAVRVILNPECVVSLGPAGRRNVRCCVLSDYACLLAQSLLCTSVAGYGGVLPKHRLIS